MNIKVEQGDKDIGKRLDLYLSLKLPDLSRSHIKKTIESNQVKLNNELCFKAGYRVKGFDVIEFPDHTVAHQPSKSLPKSPFDLEILLEDEDYIFINKPSGLIVHPTTHDQNHTLVNKLLSLYDDLPENAMLRPGIVHRLDKDTSGVIVVAKNPKSLWWLSKQFAQRSVKKEYTSIGFAHDIKIDHKIGEPFIFEGFMRRSSAHGKQFIIENVPPGVEPKGRFSKSVFTILERKDIDKEKTLFLVKINPVTGRTHQIRVHQKQLGMTIIKDPIYMSRKEMQWSSEYFKEFRLKDRLYLHASSISFENFDGKMYCVSAHLPQEYRALMKNV
jgi:23S rRNA pseudouridine1911/1915/1917 synthase